MPSLEVDANLDVPATAVCVTEDTLSVELEDGRTIAVPLVWYPRLQHGTPEELANFELSPLGIHWPGLDEDISIRGLLLGRKSGEANASLKWWLDQRAKGRKVTFEITCAKAQEAAAKHEASSAKVETGPPCGREVNYIP